MELDTFMVAVAAGAVRSGTPVLYAALGECITERAGILNVGLEGIMLVGALTSVVVSFHTESLALAILSALVAGALMGLLHGLLCIRFRANQMAAGIALTIFGGGLSAYLGIPYVGQQISSLGQIAVPWLSDIPVLGTVLFHHDALVYCSYVLVPALAWLLYHTRFGLAVRAVGEDPQSAAIAGVSVARTRFLATTLGSALAGVGGAYLALVYSRGWIENLTMGRGLIAVGLVIFAAWDPWKVVLGAYLFGGATSFQLRLQATGSNISPYLLDMIPYLLILTVLVFTTIRLQQRRGGIPAALGKPYVL